MPYHNTLTLMTLYYTNTVTILCPYSMSYYHTMHYYLNITTYTPLPIPHTILHLSTTHTLLDGPLLPAKSMQRLMHYCLLVNVMAPRRLPQYCHETSSTPYVVSYQGHHSTPHCYTGHSTNTDHSCRH